MIFFEPVVIAEIKGSPNREACWRNHTKQSRSNPCDHHYISLCTSFPVFEHITNFGRLNIDRRIETTMLVIGYYVITERSSSWYLDVIAGITGL